MKVPNVAECRFLVKLSFWPTNDDPTTIVAGIPVDGKTAKLDYEGAFVKITVSELAQVGRGGGGRHTKTVWYVPLQHVAGMKGA
jgi:hypothetical protein